ncbi:DoxX family protein [Streptacidiphilus jiangxiensis]|uniref:DoxX-like family protein n=1 Tax=Streptacidiphilus jiangxiensis TaxID=235985 RepID=A0A1H7MU87_STRJI|nr:DoxX family protein [Streptacidiphilus jiangxiensis]SEL14245.1 DoxX-like family protein [Streptacidiphilus jiangxiensis]
MNVALWIVQGLLAAVFLFSGATKATRSKEKLIASGQTGVAPFPLPVIRVVAVLEVLAAVGLVLPQATGTAQVLTPLAAVGLIAVMIGAAFAHWSLREYKQVFGVNLVVLLMCVFVATGRF